MFFYVWVCFCLSAHVHFQGQTLNIVCVVPKVGHHVALNNVHSGCHVVVHECENNYPCMAAGGSPSLVARLP